jgi:hypothetical protein
MTLKEAAAALVAKLDVIQESPSFGGVFRVAAIHHAPYIGPSWEEELNAVRAALAEPDRAEGFHFYSKEHPATFEEVARCVGPGWTPLLKELTDKLLYLGWSGRLEQVKEKYGELRFYWVNDIADRMLSDIAEDVVSEAESRSGGICEKCAKYGQRRGNGWIITRCDECWTKEKKYPGDPLEDEDDPEEEERVK